jgi:hypothetical protein
LALSALRIPVRCWLRAFPAAAFARADVSALAPFAYTVLVWATLIGYVIWLDIPSIEVWIGATIIISCGLYVIHRETLRHRAQAGSMGSPESRRYCTTLEETANETNCFD